MEYVSLLRKRYFFLMIFILSLAISGIDCKVNNNKDPNDICFKNPCYNGGKCSQTIAYPGFKCSCSGTGYFGSRCQTKCVRSVGNDRKQRATPSECIVI